MQRHARILDPLISSESSQHFPIQSGFVSDTHRGARIGSPPVDPSARDCDELAQEERKLGEAALWQTAAAGISPPDRAGRQAWQHVNLVSEDEKYLDAFGKRLGHFLRNGRKAAEENEGD